MTDRAATERASILLNLGRAEEALQLLAPFVASSQDPSPHELAVLALLALGRADDAALAAQAALESCGLLPELARVASFNYRDAGAPVRAVGVARAGVGQAPEWVPVALAPVGRAADRLTVVVLLWLISMGLMVTTCVALRVTFGYGQKRAAKAHPRDASFAS